MNEAFDIRSWAEMLLGSLAQIGTAVGAFLPRLVGALAILLVGWIVAKAVSVIARRALERIGLDTASARLGLSETLRRTDIRSEPSKILSLLLFWLFMLTFILSAAETLGLSAVTQTIDRLIAYLPNVMGAALILVIGLILARFVGNLVGSTAGAAGFEYSRELGTAARGATILVVAVLATEQLGVDTALLVTGISIAAGAFAAGLALAFALGARDVVGGILAGHYLRQNLVLGQQLEVDGRSGALERIGTTVSFFRDGDAVWIVPNGQLLGSTVISRPRGEG